jgi:MerC mercury resistance protein
MPHIQFIIQMETMITEENKKNGFITNRADYVGITGSFLCLIHCIATPFLLMSSAWLKQSEAFRESFHSLDYVFIGINIVAVYFATRNHHSTGLIAKSLWFFLGVFTVAILFEDHGTFFEYLGYFASLGLITTHFLNIRHCRTHAH